MKLKLLFVIVLITLVSCGDLTVMSYNIHAMRGMDKVVDAERIARVINDQSPDLVALQEVDMFTERSGKLDAMAILKEKTGMQGVFMKTFDYQGGEFGNAVLSRFPIIDHTLIPLPSRESYEPRLLMKVSVLLDNGDTLHFYATHLDHHRQDTDRPMQMKKIMEVIADDDHDLILAGDLNCQPGSEPITMLDGLLSRCESDALTYPADNPYWRIDYIYFADNRKLNCKGLNVIPETVASDHRPIVATFKVR